MFLLTAFAAPLLRVWVLSKQLMGAGLFLLFKFSLTILLIFLVVFKGTGSMLSMLLPWVLFWKESVADLKIFISRLRDTPAWIFSTVLYNLVFLFNVGHGFFLCNVEEIFAMLAARLQQPVIIKKKKNICQILMLFRQKYTAFFHVQCCLKSFGQCCIEFTCAMLSQEYYGNTEQDFFMYNIVWSYLDSIAQSNFPVQC